MKALLLTLLHLAVMTARLCGPGGVRAVIAEHFLLKQPLIVVHPYAVVRRTRRRGGAGREAGRVRAPAGRRLCVLRQIGDQLIPGLEQFLFVDDVVAVEDGAGLVAGGGGRERLNSGAITEAIRPSTPQGAFGARHWHTLDVCKT